MGARIRLDLRCVHCDTQETPLWRAGPLGPKTLCNACGVRWKKTGSVIPRPKRAPSRQTPPLRKRARADPDAKPPTLTPAPPDRPADGKALAEAMADAAARAASAALPAPKPVSVFRMSDSHRPKYESVFSGLMVVPRTEPHRTRTQTHKGTVYFGDFSAPPPNTPPLPRLDIALARPCSSPPPEDDGGVYVTETHAPSPSPSPPPMPRVRRGGTGVRVVLAAADDSDV